MTTVLVTRPAHQAARLVALLAARGIDAIAVPTVAIVPAAPGSQFENLAAHIDGATWLIVTSLNGAQSVVARLGADALPRSLKVAAVGPTTAGELARHGVRVDHVPSRYLTAEIAGGLGDVTGRRIVLARADAATPGLRQALTARGAQVEELVAYRTVIGPAGSRLRLRSALRRGVDGVTFTSASTVGGLVALLPDGARAKALALPAYCIGPVTARAAEAAGFTVHAVAARHTADGLAAAIGQHLAEERV